MQDAQRTRMMEAGNGEKGKRTRSGTEVEARFGEDETRQFEKSNSSYVA